MVSDDAGSDLTPTVSFNIKGAIRQGMVSLKSLEKARKHRPP